MCDRSIDLMIEQEEREIIEEMRKIEELDASIHSLELQIKEESEELSKFQFQNREKLREMLVNSPPETANLTTNTMEFMDLYKTDEIGDNFNSHEKENDEGDDFINLTDEEKERIENLINLEDSKNENNPYSIDEETKSYNEN